MLCTCIALGQDLLVTNSHLINPFVVSPSYAGFNGNHEAFVSYRSYATGLDGAPTTLTANYNGSFFKNTGLGVELDYQQYGMFRDIKSALSYAYHLHFNNRHQLSAGIRFSVAQSRIDFSGSNADPLNDPFIQTMDNQTGIGFNAGFGLNYAFEGLYISFAIPHLIKTQAKSGKQLYTQNMLYTMHAAYQLNIGRAWCIEPHVLVFQRSGSAIGYSITALTKYKDRIWLGLGYEDPSQVKASIGGLAIGRLAVQYTFGFTTGGIMNTSNGNHEISLGIQIGKVRKQPLNRTIFRDFKKAPYHDWE